MDDAGNTKDDVKVPDGELGERINKMFHEDQKDCSMYSPERFSAKGLSDLWAGF